MKTLIAILFVMMIAFGCGKSFTKEDVVGTYEEVGFKSPNRLGLFSDGTVYHLNKKGERERKFGKWKISGKEVHTTDANPGADIFRIEPNGDLTYIGIIQDGERGELRKEFHQTFKRIK